jgi:hypothetical protein
LHQNLGGSEILPLRSSALRVAGTPKSRSEVQDVRLHPHPSKHDPPASNMNINSQDPVNLIDLVRTSPAYQQAQPSPLRRTTAIPHADKQTIHPSHVRLLLRGLLYSIFFHRTLENFEPETVEILDTHIVSIDQAA